MPFFVYVGHINFQPPKRPSTFCLWGNMVRTTAFVPKGLLTAKETNAFLPFITTVAKVRSLYSCLTGPVQVHRGRCLRNWVQVAEMWHHYYSCATVVSLNDRRSQSESETMLRRITWCIVKRHNIKQQQPTWNTWNTMASKNFARVVNESLPKIRPWSA